MSSFPVKSPKVLNWQRNHKYFSTSSRPNTKQLFVWGRGDQGQLGLGNNVTLCIRPNYMDLSAIIQKDEHIKKITCGMNHTIFTTSRGGMLSFGVNEHGELGLGDFENRFNPQRIELLQNKTPTLVSCGGHHTLCATDSSDGVQVYAWGKNSYGQLGLPKSAGVCKPQEISSLRGKPISAISAGDEFSVVATPQEVLVFGRCDVGQNGQGIDQEESVARIPLSGVIRLSSGWGHTLALTKDGTVWSWGANLHSQCGTGQKTFMSGLKQLEVSNITSIACGSCHSMLLSQSGEVWIFGSSADGKMLSNRMDVLVPQLVPLSEFGRTIAIASGSDHLVVLGEDGSLRLWGFGQHGVVGTGELDIFNTPQKLFPPPHTVFSSISCGMDITAALVSPPSS